MNFPLDVRLVPEYDSVSKKTSKSYERVEIVISPKRAY